MRQHITIPQGYPEPEVGQAMPYWDTQAARNCLITPISFTSFENPDGSTTYTIDGIRRMLSDTAYQQWVEEHPEYLEFEQQAPPPQEYEPEGV